MEKKLERTLSIITAAGKPLSTNEIAERMDVDWHTANRRLETLVKQGKVHRSDVSNRLTLYWDEPIPF